MGLAVALFSSPSNPTEPPSPGHAVGSSEILHHSQERLMARLPCLLGALHALRARFAIALPRRQVGLKPTANSLSGLPLSILHHSRLASWPAVGSNPKAIAQVGVNPLKALSRKDLVYFGIGGNFSLSF